jgi:hypothetical protein
MSDVSHADIIQRVAIVETRLEVTQRELTEFKNESEAYRKENRTMVTDIHREVLRRSTIRGAWISGGKLFLAIAGLIATGVAIWKGLWIPHRGG